MKNKDGVKSKDSDELEGIKNPDNERGGGADLRVLLWVGIGEVRNLDKLKGGKSRPSGLMALTGFGSKSKNLRVLLLARV